MLKKHTRISASFGMMAMHGSSKRLEYHFIFLISYLFSGRRTRLSVSIKSNVKQRAMSRGNHPSHQGWIVHGS